MEITGLPLHNLSFVGQQKYLLKSATNDIILEAVPTKNPSQMVILQGILGYKYKTGKGYKTR
jgi:hypothetical protein